LLMNAVRDANKGSLYPFVKLHLSYCSNLNKDRIEL
jgi:hypothetical protein